MGEGLRKHGGGCGFEESEDRTVCVRRESEDGGVLLDEGNG